MRELVMKFRAFMHARRQARSPRQCISRKRTRDTPVKVLNDLQKVRKIYAEINTLKLSQKVSNV